MDPRIEVPNADELIDLPVEITQGDERWIWSVTARAADGDAVTLTWDEIAEAVSVLWAKPGGERLAIAREAIIKVDVCAVDAGVEFRVWLQSGELQSYLTVNIGSSVRVSDTLLRA